MIEDWIEGCILERANGCVLCSSRRVDEIPNNIIKRNSVKSQFSHTIC